MRKYKLIFTLQQHTPMIHFQHERKATLRMTELKPKLDRHLAVYFQENEIDDSQYRVGYSSQNQQPRHAAYDYKLRIKTLSEADVWPPWPSERWLDNALFWYDRDEEKRQSMYPMFFGNTGTESEEPTFKKFTFCEKLELEVFCLIPPLLGFLMEHIPQLLASTNFGTRQNKGFGSFTAIELDGAPIDAAQPKTPFQFYLPIRSTNPKYSAFALFEHIRVFYQTLRSGINIPFGDNRYYCKALIWAYARYKNWQWDKRTIKETYLVQNLKEQQSDHPLSEALQAVPGDDNKFLIKDLLGLSSQQDWSGQSVTKTHKGTEGIEDGKEPLQIGRFPSPLFFKPVKLPKNGGYQVYILLDKIPESYLKAAFNIQFQGYGNLELSPPTDFDLNDFMEFLFNQEHEGYLGNLSKILPLEEDKRDAYKKAKLFKKLQEIIGEYPLAEDDTSSIRYHFNQSKQAK